MWNVTNFSQLQQKMAHFFAGLIDEDEPHPWIEEQDVDYFVIVRPKRVELNKCGFIPIESQAGVSTRDTVITKLTKYRGYVQGFIIKEDIDMYLGLPLAVYVYNYSSQQVTMNNVATSKIATIVDLFDEPFEEFNASDMKDIALEFANRQTSIKRMLEREAAFVAIFDPGFYEVNALNPVKYNKKIVENVIINAIRPDNRSLRNLYLGHERPGVNGPFSLSRGFKANGGLAGSRRFQELVGDSMSHTDILHLYSILKVSQAPKEAILAVTLDIIAKNSDHKLTLPDLESFLSLIDVGYLVNDVLSLNIMRLPLATEDDEDESDLLPPSPRRLRVYEKWIRENGELNIESRYYLTPAVADVYTVLREDATWSAAKNLYTAVQIVNSATYGTLYQETLSTLLFDRSDPSRPSLDMIKAIATALQYNVIAGHPYGYPLVKENPDDSDVEDETVPSPPDAGLPAHVSVPADLRNQFYALELGSHYQDQTFTDAFNDTFKVGEYFDETSDNVLLKVVGTNGWVMLFPTSREASMKVKPRYGCGPDIWHNARRRIPVEPKYVNLANIGCGCVGVANYNAVMTLLNSDLQLIVIRETPDMSDTLISHEVLYQGQTGISDAHCQEGTQSRIYQVYIPNILSQRAQGSQNA